MQVFKYTYLLRFEYVNLIFKLYWLFKNRFEKGRHKSLIIVNCNCISLQLEWFFLELKLSECLIHSITFHTIPEKKNNYHLENHSKSKTFCNKWNANSRNNNFYHYTYSFYLSPVTKKIFRFVDKDLCFPLCHCWKWHSSLPSKVTSAQ